MDEPLTHDLLVLGLGLFKRAANGANTGVKAGTKQERGEAKSKVPVLHPEPGQNAERGEGRVTGG